MSPPHRSTSPLSSSVSWKRDEAPESPGQEPDFTTALGDDKCDVSHPSIPYLRCALRVGHGSRHAGSSRDGDSHAWG